MKFKYFGPLLTLGALAFFGAASAQASTCSTLNTTTGQIVCEASFTDLLAGDSTSLVLPLADPTANQSGYGELQSVTVQFMTAGTLNTSLKTSISTSGFVQNGGGSSQTHVTFAPTATLEVDSADNPDNSIDQDLSGFYLSATSNDVLNNVTLGKYNITGGAWPGSNTTGPAGYYYTLAEAEANTSGFDGTGGNVGADTHTGTSYIGYTTSDTVAWNDVSTQLSSDESTASMYSVSCPTTACQDFVYSGSGPTTFSVDFTSSGSYSGSGLPATGNEAQVTYVSGVMDITYQYGATGGCPGSDGCQTVTPEPATMGLFAPALAGLFLFRKRFQR